MTERRITLSGPGPARALQQAIDARKSAVWVVDQHPLGYVIRVGYYLEPAGSDPPAITWFERSEVRVKYDQSEDPHLRDAKLEVNFRHPKEHERQALIDVPAGDYKLTVRVLFRMHERTVSTFVLQVEVKSAQARTRAALPVVRYDCAHGFVHRDMLARDGSKSKTPCGADDLASAVPVVFAELREQLPAWLVELGYEDVDASSVTHDAFVAELAKAEATLIRLLEDPEEAAVVDSSLVTYTDRIPGDRLPFNEFPP